MHHLSHQIYIPPIRLPRPTKQKKKKKKRERERERKEKHII